jgi:hypothetical protein
LGRFLDDARAEAVLLTERDGLLIRAGAGKRREEDEGFIAQAGSGDIAAGGERVGCGHYGYKGFGKEGCYFEGRVGAAVAEDADVPLAACYRLHDLGGVGFVELELDGGVLAAVLAEHGGERSEHAGTDEAYAEEAGFTAGHAAGFFEILLNVAQSAAGAFKEDFAGAGEFYGARGAGEEGVAHDGFELADLLGEGRLGEVESLGSAAEMEFFGYGGEVAEVA